jgi:signal transduction histidine kinase
LQTLLADAVQRLRNATFAEFVVAWALGPDATPYVAAAAFAGADCPAEPDSDAFALAAGLSGAADLGHRNVDPELRDLARSFQFHAAVPVTSSGGAVLAVLLLRAPDLEPVRDTRRQQKTPLVPPRLLAQLDRAARSLSGPLTAALAAGRLHMLDDRVRHLDRLAGLGQLTAEIAHEVRNPLVSMKTFLQLLPERTADPEFLNQFCDVVGDELARLERLLDTLIDCGSPTPGEGQGSEAGDATEPAGESAQLGVAIESVSRLLEHRANLRGVLLETTALSDLPRVRIAPDRLRQVILNLSMNAIDASPRGETVTLEGRSARSGVELVVTDAGPGIPDELLDRIFEPFFSTRPEHPGGLGLAISRRIVEDAGGEINVETLPERGARFRIFLPVSSSG